MHWKTTKMLALMGLSAALAACNLSVKINDVNAGSVRSTDGRIDCPLVQCSFNYEGVNQVVTLKAEAIAPNEFRGFKDADDVCENGLENSLATATCVVTAGFPSRTVSAIFADPQDICPSDPDDNCLDNPEGDFDGDGLANRNDNCPTDASNDCDEGDSDGDGILNGSDVCPNDPDNDCLANAGGDFDGDGVANADDVCPEANPDTCPVGDLDNDGVINEADDCPTDNPDTCAAGDLDGDGVSNGNDACPQDDADMCPEGDPDRDRIKNKDEPIPCRLDPDPQCIEEAKNWVVDTVRHTLPAHGGDGSAAKTFNCAPNHVMVAINGRAGDRIDQLSFECRDLLPKGGTGNSVHKSGNYGGSGGSGFSDRCPANKMINAVYGRSGSRVDRIGFSCGSLSAVLEQRSESDHGPWGGSGGGAFNDKCPTGYAVTGVNLRSGGEIDKVQFICSRIVWWLLI